MKPALLLLLLLALSSAACSTPPRVIYGQSAVSDPLASGYAKTAGDGNVYVSPALAAKLKRQ